MTPLSPDRPESESADDSDQILNTSSSGNIQGRAPSPDSESLFEQTDCSSLDAMSQLSDVRQDRVAALQKAIETGTYSVSTEQVAEKLIQEISLSRPEDPDSSP